MLLSYRLDASTSVRKFSNVFSRSLLFLFKLSSVSRKMNRTLNHYHQVLVKDNDLQNEVAQYSTGDIISVRGWLEYRMKKIDEFDNRSVKETTIIPHSLICFRREAMRN